VSDKAKRSPFSTTDPQKQLPGVYLGPGVHVHETARIGPYAVILGSDDDSQPGTIIAEGAEIGANATVTPGITIGVRAQIKPGSVVTRSVPPLAIVEGNPAKIIGYVETSEHRYAVQETTSRDPLPLGVHQTRVNGVTLHHFKMVPDLRGSLSVAEFDHEFPFIPKRYFLVYDVPTAETRGEHAHLQCAQLLVAVKGSVCVIVDDGSQRDEIILNRPQYGIYVPPMTWSIQYNYSSDAVLLVFASDTYDSKDYIREYTRFLELVKRTD
jgi:dTDP-4-dehydrorhamnose 3,5-epimerase-like enzyme